MQKGRKQSDVKMVGSDTAIRDDFISFALLFKLFLARPLFLSFAFLQQNDTG